MISTLKEIRARLFNLQVGGFTAISKVSGSQLAVTATTYASANTLGSGNPISSELVRSSTGSCILQSVTIQDLSNQSGAIDLLFFDANPSATTFTNNVALDIADADITKLIGTVSIVSSDYKAFSDNAVATKTNIGLTLKAAGSTATSIYVAAVSRDTKTYAANELSIALGVLQD